MWGVVMLEICLVCGFALLDIYLVIDTKRKLKERENACNIVLNNAKLKCNKCQGEMIENLSLVPDDVWGGLRIYKEGVEHLKCFVKPSVAVCKECGSIELYVRDMDGINNLL